MNNNDTDKIKSPNGKTKETVVSFPDSSVLQTLVGEKDAHLRLLAKKLEVEVARCEDGLRIIGHDADVDLASDLITQLRGLLEKGEQLYPGDMERAIAMLSGDRRLKLEDLFREQIKIAGRKHAIVPKTATQKFYLEAIQNSDIVFGLGPAGTGKTYLAMAMAISALMKREVKRVVLCRPAVEAGEKLGFLPGDMAEKVNPYLRPLYDALHDMVDYDKAHEMVEKGQVEVAPLAFMRGRTLSKAFVVLDEAQNTSTVQMKMLLTRLGRHSKCVVTGDLSQIDLPPDTTSGLSQAVDLLQGIEGIEMITFSEEDVIRHRLVANIISAYEKKNQASGR